MSKGYKVASEKAEPFEIVVPAPAGALSASGADMARFMIAHLQDGSYEGAQILKPETAKLMHARQRGKSPETDAMCLGFYEESRNGHRIIGHGGDTNWFHSDLHLIPDANVGFFVSYNSGGNGEGQRPHAPVGAVPGPLLPVHAPAATRAADAKAQAQKVAGNYLVSRREDTHFLRLLYLSSRRRSIRRADDDGNDRGLGAHRLQRETEQVGADRQRRVPRGERPGEGRLPDGPARPRRARHGVPVLRLLPAAGVLDAKLVAAGRDRERSSSSCWR